MFFCACLATASDGMSFENRFTLCVITLLSVILFEVFLPPVGVYDKSKSDLPLLTRPSRAFTPASIYFKNSAIGFFKSLVFSVINLFLIIYDNINLY